MQYISRTTRDKNLDLLRAIAIISVVAFHVVQMSPISLPFAMRFFQYGMYGVDLFFVLSGWLIGGIYWNEYNQCRTVDILHFWKRRWLRTIPPYLGALILSWIAVRISREESFNFGYLIFIQNYYDTMPFFLVSWSLCIEEHFYFLIPLLFKPILHHSKAILLMFCSLLLLSPILRVYRIDDISNAGLEFGYNLTATHFRLDGLLLGFMLSWLKSVNNYWWHFLKKNSLPMIVFSSASCIAFLLQNTAYMYVGGLFSLAVLFASFICFFENRPPKRIAHSPIIRCIAVTSYSVYLTHALAIHLSRIIISKIPENLWPIYFPLTLFVITTVGYVYYITIEKTALKIREIIAPRNIS